MKQVLEKKMSNRRSILAVFDMLTLEEFDAGGTELKNFHKEL